MRLRHVLLLTAGAGAIGALLLALDIHHRFRIAERNSIVNSTPIAPDSVLNFGEPYLLGLAALGFLFAGIFLMVFSNPDKAQEKEKKDEKKAAEKPAEKVEEKQPAAAPVPSTSTAPVPLPTPPASAPAAVAPTPPTAPAPAPVSTEAPAPVAEVPASTTPV